MKKDKQDRGENKEILTVMEYLGSDEYAERCRAQWHHYLKHPVILKRCPIIKLNKNEGK
jgi:hypothetical protein